MAHRIQVMSIFRPRVDQGRTVQKPELIRAISRATSIVEGVADLVIKELRDHIIEFLLSGRAVKIEGLGTWTPNIGLDGTLDIQYRADPARCGRSKSREGSKDVSPIGRTSVCLAMN